MGDPAAYQARSKGPATGLRRRIHGVMKSAESLIHCGGIRDGVQPISESDGLERDK